MVMPGSRVVIMSPMLLLVFFAVVIVGYLVVNFVAKRKWGYTLKRERELERKSDMVMHTRKEQKEKVNYNKDKDSNE